MQKFSSKTQKIGEIGEDIACRFLVKHGFKIIERNYTKKWGEIDIIIEKSIKSNVFLGRQQKKLYFIEVKTVSRDLSDVSYETQNLFRPEENVHHKKIKRLRRAIQTYLLDRHVSRETNWQFDLIFVFLDLKNKKAKVETIANVVI